MGSFGEDQCPMKADSHYLVRDLLFPSFKDSRLICHCNKLSNVVYFTGIIVSIFLTQ